MSPRDIANISKSPKEVLISIFLKLSVSVVVQMKRANQILCIR